MLPPDHEDLERLVREGAIRLEITGGVPTREAFPSARHQHRIIVSRGYEYKDATLNPPFYLSHGIRDVVNFDPAAARVKHYTRSGAASHYAPVQLQLTCGCDCTIPA